MFHVVPPNCNWCRRRDKLMVDHGSMGRNKLLPFSYRTFVMKNSVKPRPEMVRKKKLILRCCYFCAYSSWLFPSKCAYSETPHMEDTEQPKEAFYPTIFHFVYRYKVHLFIYTRSTGLIHQQNLTCQRSFHQLSRIHDDDVSFPSLHSINTSTGGFFPSFAISYSYLIYWSWYHVMII